MPPELHELCLPIEGLLGTWRGRGRGAYPTIDDFEYEEESRFFHVGKPFVAYTQRTWDPADDKPLHSEMGYWRPQVGGGIEVVLSHPFGYAEVTSGTVEPGRISLESTSLVPMTGAKAIEAVNRTITFDQDLLTYKISMAAVGKPMQFHLEATLARVSP
jgi:hypothetical protein